MKQWIPERLRFNLNIWANSRSWRGWSIFRNVGIRGNALFHFAILKDVLGWIISSIFGRKHILPKERKCRQSRQQFLNKWIAVRNAISRIALNFQISNWKFKFHIKLCITRGFTRFPQWMGTVYLVGCVGKEIRIFFLLKMCSCWTKIG